MTDHNDCDCFQPPSHWTMTFGGIPEGSLCPPLAGPPDDGRAHPIPAEVHFELSGVPLAFTHWRREPDGSVRLLFGHDAMEMP